MSRHRKVDVRVWGDDKFRGMTAPAPCGRYLWLYLMTGPHTTSIPGLFVAGEAALAEALGWPLKGFREAFREASERGMAEADWNARLVWLPNAIRYNFPENPNVVKSWRAYWDEIPECHLKVKAYGVLRQQLASKETFLKAFLETIAECAGMPLAKPLGTPLPNQEQEQEQEQEQDLSATDKPSPHRPRAVSPQISSDNQASDPTLAGPRKRKPDALFAAVAEVTASDPIASGSHIGRVCKALRSADPPYTPDEVRAWADKIRTEWNLPDHPGLGMLEKYIGRIRSGPLPPPRPGARQGKRSESVADRVKRIQEEKCRQKKTPGPPG